MFLSELLQFVLYAAAKPPTEEVWCGYVGAGYACPASSFTAIGAAFATQGYFAQADLIWQLINTDFGLWAPLIYILAAAGGLVSLALGAPPKMYLWFFFGPAIYNFLLGTTVPVRGVEWRVANKEQNQSEVWKLAEVGLANSNVVLRSQQDGMGQPIMIRQFQRPTNPVYVSYMFAWFDELMSSTVQWMVGLTGIYNQVGDQSNASGLYAREAGKDSGGQWYLLSGLKWTMLDKITSARLHSGDLRDAFATYISGECGDALGSVINKTSFVAAHNASTAGLPQSIFRGAEQTSGGGPVGPPVTGGTQSTPPNNYDLLTQRLVDQSVPVPPSLRTMWSQADESGNGSFAKFFNYQSSSQSSQGIFGPYLPETDYTIDQYLSSEHNINCADYLYFILNGFRWEAGQIYYQLVRNLPLGAEDSDIVYNLFYGWNLLTTEEKKLNEDQRKWFLQDLILVHLLRNEMAIAPKLIDSRYSTAASDPQTSADLYLAQTGAKSKYGEIYTYALMIPYVQGILLYVLALGFPIASVLIIVPGWHRALFTWMSFWAWTKLWDLGFAVVMVLERTIWAMIGNNRVATGLGTKVVEMQQWGRLKVDDCAYVAGSGFKCPVIPVVQDMVSSTEGMRWNDLMSLFDRALIVGASIDLDIQNGYYIYLMSALYFAVPAATGQLVLGAKAGVAGMATNLIDPLKGDASRASGQAFTGDLRQKAAANAAAVDNESKAKAYRQQGLASQAIAASNMQLDEGLNSSVAGAKAQALGAQQGIYKLNEGIRQSNLSAGSSMRKLGYSLGGLGVYGVSNYWAGVSERNDPAFDKSIQAATDGTQPGGAAPAGAAPKGGTATGAATGSGGPTGGPLTAMLGSGYHASQAVKNARVDAISALGNNAITRGYSGIYASMQAAQSGLQIDQFAASARQQGYSMGSGRMQQEAAFGAEMSSFQARRDYANQVSSYLGALGVDSSVVSPGQKPSDMMGMAMSGMLGSSMRSAAQYASPDGGYFSQVGTWGNQLHGAFGAGALMGTFSNGGTPGGAYEQHAQAFDAFAQNVNSEEGYRDMMNRGTPAVDPLSKP